MNRRKFLTAAGTAATSACFSIGRPRPSVRARPNILLAIADDVSYPHMGAYGCSWIRTPAFDRVAREGLLFNSAYTPNAKCAPSRACILTGRNSWQLEEAANHWCFFPSKFRTFPEALAESGYHVGFTAKGWAPGVPGEIAGRPRQMTGRPFNERRTTPPVPLIGTHDYAANFSDFLDAKGKDQPFCFWYGSVEPHRPYDFGRGVKSGKRISDIDRVFPFWPDNDEVRRDLLDYAFEIEYFDRCLHRILNLLEERGELDNTLVVVTADNGMPFPRIKGQAYEYSNHLPLAMMWRNGIKNGGRQVHEHVSFVDFAPTFLELAETTQTASGMAKLAGLSLTDILGADSSGRKKRPRDFILVGKERHDVGRPNDAGYPIRGILRNGYLYLRNFEPERWPAGNPETGYLNCDGSPTKTQCLLARRSPQTERYWQACFGKRPPEELYCVETEPDCLTNLAGRPEFRDLQGALRSELRHRLEEQGDPRMVGKGHVFDDYVYADPSGRGFYERYMKGEKMKAGWVNETDFDPIR